MISNISYDSGTVSNPPILNLQVVVYSCHQRQQQQQQLQQQQQQQRRQQWPPALFFES